MARILLHSLVFSPDGVSTAGLMTELALELRNLGHDIRVLTTTPHYNLDEETRAHQPLSPHWGKLLQRSDCGGIPVFHVNVSPKGQRVLGRVFEYGWFHVLSLAAGWKTVGRYDLILAPSPPLTIGLVAGLLGWLRRVPVVYNVQEIYPDVAVRLGVLRNRLLIGVLKRLERMVYRQATKVVVISEWFRRRLVTKGVPEGKMVVIPNFVNTDFIQPANRHNPFSAIHNLDDRFVVLYAGNIGLTQGMETVLAAARMLQDLPDLGLLIVGDGVRRQWLCEQLATGDFPQVKFLPYQPRSAVRSLYAGSDLCLVPLKGGMAQETFPSKIYTIMAAGRPVVASADADSELAWVVQEAKCGWAIPPDDPAALVEAIRSAHTGRQQLAAMGQRGRDYVMAHHSRPAVARLYNDLFTEILGNR